MNAPVLEVKGLHVEFPTRRGPVYAVRNVSLHVDRGEVLGLVGESGCGKSVTMRTLMGLVPSPGRITAGELSLEGRDLLGLKERELRRIRGGDITLIAQDPVNAFNPSLRIGYQMTRVLKLHRETAPEIGWDREAEAMLEHVGIDPQDKLRRYSFNFSQGQLQRVMTAMATLSSKPKVLLADEPTTSLDVTVEAQILALIRTLREETGMAVVYVTHDLGVIAQMADRVAVMYAGSIVEEAPVRKLFAEPRHPYTVGLLRSSGGVHDRSTKRMVALPGAPPDLTNIAPGCPFAPRCNWATGICQAETPELRLVGERGRVACHHAEQVQADAARSRAEDAPAL